MTSAEMRTLTRFLAGDPNSQIWTSDTDIYNALSIAQRSFVNRVLGSTAFKDNFEVFTDISKAKAVSVGISGYTLSGLTRMARNGYINSKCTLDGYERYITRLPSTKIGLSQNQFIAGNNWSPTCYILNNVYYLQVSQGSYPVNVTIFYVSTPDDIDGSTEPVVNIIYHDLLCLMAESHLRRSIDDYEQSMFIEQNLIMPLIQAVAIGQTSEPQSRTIAQYMRDKGVKS